MSNAVTIILIVGVAAVGIAYFANMFCQPSGGVLCFNPIPVAPAEDIEGGKALLPSYLQGVGQLIGPSLGGQAPKTGLLSPLGGQAAPGQALAELRAAGLSGGKFTPKKLTSTLTGALTPAQSSSVCRASKGPGYCWSEGAGRCVKCGSTSGSNFAESEAYYVRTA